LVFGFWSLVFGVLAYWRISELAHWLFIDNSQLPTHGLWSLVFGIWRIGVLAHWRLCEARPRVACSFSGGASSLWPAMWAG